MRETVEAVISKVTPQPYGWDVAFAPDDDPWISIGKDEGFPEVVASQKRIRNHFEK